MMHKKAIAYVSLLIGLFFLLALALFALADVDSDNDGVNDNEDFCANTVIPEQNVPSEHLGINRFALINNDGVFDTVEPNGKGPRKSFNIQQTKGCSCEQIIDILAKGLGHEKFGCSISVMEDFINFVISSSTTTTSTTTTTLQESCIDSDNGLNITVKGTVEITNSSGSFAYMDECFNTTSVKEWYCGVIIRLDGLAQSGPQAFSQIIECSQGCIDGVCIEFPPA